MANRVFASAVLSSALALASFSSHAMAANVGAEAAAQLLAKASVADNKCHFLQSADHEELSSLVARAEIALASQSDVAHTKSTMAAGRAEGMSSSCSPDMKAEVESILSAARSASLRAASATDSATPAEPAAAMATPPVAKLSAGQPRPHVSGGLATYAAMTERYYKVRRCNSMPRQAMNSFYQDIVATHHMMVKTYGVPAVAAVMHQSESTADHQGCG